MLSPIQQAIQVFIQGDCFTRSLTHPYLAEPVGRLWVLRDAPRRSGTYRNEEWVAYGLAVEEIDGTIRANARGRYVLCVICGMDEPQGPLRAGFKALGYRLGSTEPFFLHRLATIPAFESPAAIERVHTAEQAARLAKANGARQMSPEYCLPESPLRQYMATINGEAVGWVRSIRVAGSAWCTDMAVKPAFRRQGIARAMLSRMLADDRADRTRASVLLASHAGALLYPAVGYEQIGTLLLYHPGKQ